MYRPDSIQQESDYTLAFVEFDDQGELWSPPQFFHTVDLIEEANQDEYGSIVFVFIHGWNNNASPKHEQKKDYSLNGFKQFLAQVAKDVRVEYPERPRSVIGVFLAWRGQSAYSPFRTFTFWNRRRAATRIASGLAVQQVLLRVIDAANLNPRSRTALIGHSFGGLLMEQALLHTLATGFQRAKTGDIDLAYDLILLLNPAAPSLLAKQLIEVLELERTQLYRIDSQGNRYQRPIMVSVTSVADRATRVLYPIGSSFGVMTSKFRKYGPEYCHPVGSQRSFYLYTAGHNKVLHSHDVRATPLPPEGSPDEGLQLRREDDPVSEQPAISFNGSEHRFTLTKKPLALNDTPYWIMRVPKSLIPDHSDIFRLDTVRLIQALIVGTGALELDSRTVLVRETGIRPLALGVGPLGNLIFAERSGRFYVLPKGSSVPSFLACTPPGINPAQVIALFGERNSVSYIINQAIDSGGKKEQQEYRTELVRLSLLEGGFKPAEQKRFRGSRHFVTASADLVRQKIYLATEDEIYVADLSQPRPEPALVVRTDGGKLNRIIFDANGNRLLALDIAGGQLYLVNLDAAEPELRLGATALGRPVHIAIDPNHKMIYIADNQGRQVWRLECDNRTCVPPQVFVRSSAFRTPSRLALAPDGTLWIGDLEAQKIFAVGADGNIRQTISSLTGEQ
jgi:pimeloyl-ACP methyl ester carboxylesterase